jgi:hypothetical protein
MTAELRTGIVRARYHLKHGGDLQKPTYEIYTESGTPYPIPEAMAGVLAAAGWPTEVLLWGRDGEEIHVVDERRAAGMRP